MQHVKRRVCSKMIIDNQVLLLSNNFPRVDTTGIVFTSSKYFTVILTWFSVLLVLGSVFVLFSTYMCLYDIKLGLGS